tara:strand:+ start:642 stop:794 length:153 start_codon:yes stop_codon:yes gene_type:complete
VATEYPEFGQLIGKCREKLRKILKDKKMDSADVWLQDMNQILQLLDKVLI